MPCQSVRPAARPLTRSITHHATRESKTSHRLLRWHNRPAPFRNPFNQLLPSFRTTTAAAATPPNAEHNTHNSLSLARKLHNSPLSPKLQKAAFSFFFLQHVLCFSSFSENVLCVHSGRRSHSRSVCYAPTTKTTPSPRPWSHLVQLFLSFATMLPGNSRLYDPDDGSSSIT